MRFLNSATRFVRSVPVLGKLTWVAGILAVAMNFFLFARDENHRSDRLTLALNHLLNISIWFIAFVFTIFLIFGLFQLVSKLIR